MMTTSAGNQKSQALLFGGIKYVQKDVLLEKALGLSRNKTIQFLLKKSFPCFYVE